MNAFPDELQTLLLQAALMEGEAAHTAITAWVDLVDLEKVDWASQRLVPLLFENMRNCDFVTPYHKILKGVYVYWLFRNNLNMSRLKEVVVGLKGAGVTDIMLLKGCALANFFYSNVALRPMSDIDILVKPADAVAAINALKDMGFRPIAAYKGPEAAEAIFMTFTQLDFSHPNYGEVDLHWEILPTESNRYFDENVWKNAEQRELDGEQCLIPCAADLMIHTLDHGLLKNVMQPIWWVADVHAIMRSEAKIDWSYLYSQAALVGRVGIINEAFLWWESVLYSDKYINRPRVSPAIGDVIYLWYRRTVNPYSRIACFKKVLQGFKRYCDLAEYSWTPARFLLYLQVRWNLANLSDIPERALQKWIR
jgi:hypothetical protein